VGKGAYGCVFRPGIRCSQNRTRSANEISKYMTYNAARSEYAKKNYLKELNAEQEFIVYPTRMCMPRIYMNRSDREKANLARCSLKDQKPTHLLQMKNAGNSLYPLTLKVENPIAFLKSLVPLCLGVRKLHDANIAHLDIKLGNLVTRKQPDGSYLTRLIDVGLMQKMTEYESVSDREKSVFSGLYFAWPYETRYLDPANPITGTVTRQQTAAYYEYAVRNIQPPIDVRNLYYTSEFGHTLTPALLNNVILPHLRSFPRVNERNTFLAKTTDIYGLGLVLLQLNAFLKSPALDALGKKMIHILPQERPAIGVVCEELSALVL
jgi:hypothetical protein